MRILIFGRPAVAAALVALAEKAKAAGALTVTWADPKHFSSRDSQLRLDVDAVVIDGSHSRHAEIADTYFAESNRAATDEAPASRFFGKRVIVVPPDSCDEDHRNVLALLGLAQEVPVVDGGEDDDEDEDDTELEEGDLGEGTDAELETELAGAEASIEEAPVTETPAGEAPATEETPATETPATESRERSYTAVESLGYPELKALAREKSIAVKGNTPKVDIVAALHAAGVTHVER